jgi:hypothetical protein
VPSSGHCHPTCSAAEPERRTWRAEGLRPAHVITLRALRLLSVSLGLITAAQYFAFLLMRRFDWRTSRSGSPGVVKKDELPTSAGKWFRQQCDAEDEEGDAFRDLMACGMGWTETRLDLRTIRRAIPRLTEPTRSKWYGKGRKKRNLVDARRV